MYGFQETALWKRTLGAFQNGTAPEDPTIYLRDAFFVMRDRARPVAERIAADLPEYTVHDISHLDALWEIADLIIGPNYPITPVEAFVMGAAFLLHDLGLGLAAFPKGIQEIKKEPVWKDQVSLKLRSQLGHPPTSDEIANADNAIVADATKNTLRRLHARRAEELAFVSWEDSGSRYFLIENPELRNCYGRLIGTIAHSHWWPVSRLASVFPERLGPPAFLNAPPAWTLDPLKLACVLRAADVAHLDSRRAPGFQRALRQPKDASRDHWVFQEHLQKPRVDDDRLVFTSASPFEPGEASAWWQCMDALASVDRELQEIDALFSDMKRDRFKVRAVAAVDDPTRLALLVPTRNWTPIDARLKVSNVVRLVDRLGGRELYGDDVRAPLRELIQNAQDAIGVREALEKSFPAGAIVVRLFLEAGHYYLEVEDNGVGMAAATLAGTLLDFGNSFWNSQEVLEEFPGLLSSEFAPVGQFGIGFFSVFMLGDEITVLSRRFDAARSDVRVLQFPGGLTSRGLLRMPIDEENLGNSSTRVRVRLKKKPHELGGLLWFEDEYEEKVGAITLEDACAWLCPALAVDLFVEEGDRKPKKIISGGDWLTLAPEKLMKRVWKFHEGMSLPGNRARFKELKGIFRPLRSDQGQIIGRGCIFPDSDLWPIDYDRGTVTVGGLRSTFLGSIAGIFAGFPTTAARDDARILASTRNLGEWATEQGELISRLELPELTKMHAAAIVHSYGGNVGDLPVCRCKGGFLNLKGFRDWCYTRSEVKIIGWVSDISAAERFPGWKLDSNALITDSHQPNHFELEQATLGISLERDDYLKLPAKIRNQYFYAKHSLIEILVAALAEVWEQEPLALFQLATSRWDGDVVVGHTDHGDLFGSADVFRRGESRH